MQVGEPSRGKRGAACRELEEGLPLLAVQSHQHVHKPKPNHIKALNKCSGWKSMPNVHFFLNNYRHHIKKNILQQQSMCTVKIKIKLFSSCSFKPAWIRSHPRKLGLTFARTKDFPWKIIWSTIDATLIVRKTGCNEWKSNKNNFVKTLIENYHIDNHYFHVCIWNTGTAIPVFIFSSMATLRHMIH